MFTLYNLIMHAVVAVLMPYYFFNRFVSRRGKQRQGLLQRLGIGFGQYAREAGGRPIVWIHAVSVGETQAAIPLIKKFRRAYPDLYLLLSNVTETGHAIAEKVEDLDAACYLPFDLPWSMGRVFGFLQPELLILIETELWPNLIRRAHRANVPTMMINGRISDRSFPRYLKAKALLAPLLQRLAFFSMQSPLDQERIIAMGAIASRVRVNGNTKFDFPPVDSRTLAAAPLLKAIQIPAEAEVLVAGSTHPGEEDILLSAFAQLRREHQNLRLILVPRRPERRQEVATLVAKAGYEPLLRSQLAAANDCQLAGDQVLIGDSIGEMLAFYNLADLVFVGGSLAPVGGHNLLEAGLVGKPVLFGPQVHNFRKISELVLKSEAGLQVADENGLVAAVSALLSDPARALAMGEAGARLIAEHRGAIDQLLHDLRPWLAELKIRRVEKDGKIRLRELDYFPPLPVSA